MATKDITDAQVVQAQAEAKAGGFATYAYDILAARTGQPFKVCYRAMERAERRGLLEYGVSLRTAWLTEKGIAMLKAETAPGTVVISRHSTKNAGDHIIAMVRPGVFEEMGVVLITKEEAEQLQARDPWAKILIFGERHYVPATSTP